MPSRRSPPLRRVKAEFSLNLHPSTAGNVLDGVRQELNGLLLRWAVLTALIAHIILRVSQSRAIACAGDDKGTYSHLVCKSRG
jgi:hypothetical protein